MAVHTRCSGGRNARFTARKWGWLALLTFVAVGSRTAVSQPDETVPALLLHLEQVLISGQPDQYVALAAPSADREAAAQFATTNIAAGITHAAVRERERTPLPASSDGPAGLRLIVDVFTERGDRGIVSTWRLDLEPLPTDREARAADASETTPSPESNAAGGPAAPQEPAWAIRAQDRLSFVEGLYRLRLDRNQQYVANGLRIEAEDLRLNVRDGIVHLAVSDGGATALVVVGRGDMEFSPAPPAEKGQVRLFAGNETLRTRFVRAFVRINPGDLDDHLIPSRLGPARSVDASALAEAQEFFDSRVATSFSLDLSDLSRDTWSLVPSVGDFLMDVDTDRFGVLTYTRSQSDAEDISLFDRSNRKNIAVYTSAERLARRGRSYDHAARLAYDVYRYDVDVSISPDRAWIEGRTGIDLRVRAYALSALTLRLAESLVVRSVVADRFGRLLTLRVRGQNSFIVNFPEPVGRDEWLTLQVFYSGRLPPQALDREAIVLGPPPVVPQELEGPLFAPEPRFLYSNRSYWYPQATINEYALARLRLSVPARLNVVASGVLAPGSPTVAPDIAGRGPRKTYVFNATQPLRYLSAIVSRLTDVTSHVVARTDRGDDYVPSGRPGVYYDSVSLAVVANPRQVGRARALAGRAAEILGFYQSVLHDAPYPAVTLAAVDDVLPGGHSPAYLGILNQPTLPTALSWRNDPVSFDNFPDFFLAHELAHQYWGQAVGWENYHEQWISEGFAQFFALLYAERTHDRRAWVGILRQMRRSVERYPGQGPIWLGYRLGHLKGDSRIFRAILYNKGALVLDMLRQWLGDEAFFRGLRRFYDEARFRRVGTEDVRRAFEEASGARLERFFERWLYDDAVPQIRVTWRVVDPQDEYTTDTRFERSFRAPQGEASDAPTESSDGGERPLQLRVEQIGETFDLPLTVELQYASGERQRLLLRLARRVTNLELALKGPLRRVEVDPDEISLATLVEGSR
ncbi:MAG: hypothetical protein GEV06_20840 [Luteitalea sp.]|nr:hypothetical protein [Luteitalea sp.]